MVFNPTTDALLKKALPSLPRIVIEKELKHDIDDLVAQVFSPMKLAVVDDSNTASAYGDAIFKALKGRFPCTHVTLTGNPVADDQTVKYLRTQVLSADALIAVGSGTINDLCKYVSHLDRKPYVVFPTAASMNGYLSANASITVAGHKKTMLAFMPQAVFCDVSIIGDAPSRLNKSGLGDSLARSTAQADWLLSHLLLDTHYDEMPFELLAPLEEELFDGARGIAKSDVASLQCLMKTLLLSGLGMTIAGGSYPASGGEHMIAHAYDMMHQAQSSGRSGRDGSEGGGSMVRTRKATRSTLHGEAIGVTTLNAAVIQERLLHGSPSVRADDFNSEQMIQLFGSEVATQSRKAFDGKYALVRHAMEHNSFSWDAIAARISKVIVPIRKIQAVLDAAGAPSRQEDIGWSQENYDLAVSYARYTRERFTFLDLQ